MNSLGDNRSSKILFGKRKNWPLQFLRIRNPPSKLFERIFCWVKNKKCLEKNSLYYTEKNPHFVRVFFKILYTLFTFNFTLAKKYPSIIQRKIWVLLMCFERKFTNYFNAKKRFAPNCRANLIFYIVYPSKLQRWI